MKRKPAACGRFYAENETALRKQIEKYVHLEGDKKAIAVVVPHAGYDFSGRTAGAVFSEVRIPNTAIILGPNHWISGSDFAIVSEGAWEMPFGEARIASEVAVHLKEVCDFLREDAAVHRSEHSLEVEIPFLQYLNPNVQIVPIAIGSLDETKLEALGRSIAETIEKSEEEVLLVASTDMSHTEQSDATRQATVRRKDMMAIEAILELDAGKLLRVVKEQRVTMCGAAPVASAITAAKLLGARNARLVSYTTSHDVTGDYSYVVGYAGIVID
ncbi:AmmeMemoRadiSam system protein B [bacterium]|nr:AmmeMemoRadiSam system protein B [bacterium]